MHLQLVEYFCVDIAKYTSNLLANTGAKNNNIDEFLNSMKMEMKSQMQINRFERSKIHCVVLYLCLGNPTRNFFLYGILASLACITLAKGFKAFSSS